MEVSSHAVSEKRISGLYISGGYVFRVDRTSADYTGTSFEIQFFADSGATAFGDPVLLACEV
jgi:hypothetical protein